MDVRAVELRVLKEKLEVLKKNAARHASEMDALISENEMMRPFYDYYRLIQNACKNNPMVAEELSRFLMICKLSEEDETPGLTVEETNNQRDFGF